MSTPRIWLGISSDEWLINSNTPHVIDACGVLTVAPEQKTSYHR